MNHSHPRIWNVPHNRNPHLVGRTEELEELRRTFGVGDLASFTEHARGVGGALGGMGTGRRDVVALTQTIAGLGGIGKTSLATEYCYRFENEYDVVWWLRAQESATLAGDYAALAAKLEPRLASEPNQPALIEFVREWLRQNERWLLIFDNANAPEEIRDYLPPVGSGHILITSRHSVWADVGKTVALPKLPRAQSIELLKTTGDTDETAANALAEELGDFPLALEHARAYVLQASIPLAQYLELYRTQHTALWGSHPQPFNYHSTITTTWELAFQEISKNTPEATDLLNLCAFFAPDDIPLDVIIEGAKFLPESLAAVVSDALKLNGTIGALRHYSLIERKENNLSVHRLVQQVTRDRMEEDARKRWAAATVKLVADAFPFQSDDVLTWNKCEKLLLHASTITESSDATKQEPGWTGRLLNQIGLYLHGRAQFAEARAKLERALAIEEKAFGTDNSKVASTLNNLGNVLQDLGDLRSAQSYLERALAIDENKFGPEHLNVAIRVNNLGNVLQDFGDLKGARSYYERALAIDEKQFGADHPQVAIDVNNLGTVLRDLGDVAGAKAYFERALAIDEKQFGADHPDVAVDVNNLGMLNAEFGDKEAARRYLERAYEIFRQFLGEEHPKTRTVKENLDSLGGGLSTDEENG